MQSQRHYKQTVLQLALDCQGGTEKGDRCGELLTDVQDAGPQRALYQHPFPCLYISPFVWFPRIRKMQQRLLILSKKIKASKSGGTSTHQSHHI